jgi:serine/threonine protein kinase
MFFYVTKFSPASPDYSLRVLATDAVAALGDTSLEDLPAKIRELPHAKQDPSEGSAQALFMVGNSPDPTEIITYLVEPDLEAGTPAVITVYLERLMPTSNSPAARFDFSVAEVRFTDASGRSPFNSDGTNAINATPEGGSLSTGTIAAIAVASAVVLILFASVALLRVLARRRRGGAEDGAEKGGVGGKGNRVLPTNAASSASGVTASAAAGSEGPRGLRLVGGSHASVAAAAEHEDGLSGVHAAHHQMTIMSAAGGGGDGGGDGGDGVRIAEYTPAHMDGVTTGSSRATLLGATTYNSISSNSSNSTNVRTTTDNRVHPSSYLSVTSGSKASSGGSPLIAARNKSSGDIAYKIDAAAVEIGELIGRGGFGRVYAGVYAGTQVAVKIIMCSGPEDQRLMENEVKIGCSVRHPNCALFIGFFERENDVGIVMERLDQSLADYVVNEAAAHAADVAALAAANAAAAKTTTVPGLSRSVGNTNHNPNDGSGNNNNNGNNNNGNNNYGNNGHGNGNGSSSNGAAGPASPAAARITDTRTASAPVLPATVVLADAPRLEALDPMDALSVLVGVARGMAYLHERGIVHRDLKPQNVMLSSLGEPRITDFGVSKSMDESTMDTRAGTVKYMAPENILGQAYGPPADVFSYGILLYFVLTGKQPYETAGSAGSGPKGARGPGQGVKVPALIAYEVANEGLRPEFDPGMHPALVQLAKECWQRDPAARPTFEQIVERTTNLWAEALDNEPTVFQRVAADAAAGDLDATAGATA